jgi:hypothetical protein
MSVNPKQLEGLITHEVRMSAGEIKFEFTGRDFLLSSRSRTFISTRRLTTNILRWKSLNIGKWISADLCGSRAERHRIAMTIQLPRADLSALRKKSNIARTTH